MAKLIIVSTKLKHSPPHTIKWLRNEWWKSAEPVGYVSAIPIKSPQSIVAVSNATLNIPVYANQPDASAQIEALKAEIETLKQNEQNNLELIRDLQNAINEVK